MPLTKVHSACVSITLLIPATGIWFLPGCCWNVSWHSQSCTSKASHVPSAVPQTVHRSCSSAQHRDCAIWPCHSPPSTVLSLSLTQQLWRIGARLSPALTAEETNKRWDAQREGNSPIALHTHRWVPAAPPHWEIQLLLQENIGIKPWLITRATKDLWGEGFHPTVYYKTQIMYVFYHLQGSHKTQRHSEDPIISTPCSANAAFHSLSLIQAPLPLSTRPEFIEDHYDNRLV